MMRKLFSPAVFLLLLILVPFFIHYLSIHTFRLARLRLERSRYVYLGLSLQLVFAAWWFASAAENGGLTAFVLLAAGMSFSFCGDFFNLQFPAVAGRIPEPVFAGIICFVLAQCFYTSAFLNALPPAVMLKEGFYLSLVILIPLVSALIFRFRVWKPGRPRYLMTAAFIYTFFLGAMAATALSAALAAGGTWWYVAAGAGFFLLSDSVMGETTIAGKHPVWEFQIPWGTYLAAQALIIGGFAALLF